MGQMFRKAADGIKNSAFVIPITLVFLAMLIISIGLFYEDYSTSYMGYKEFPTRKVNDWIIPLVALVPQLAQIGFGYVFASDTNKRYAILITTACFVIDGYTDLVYKSDGFKTIYMTVLAFFETITIYTLFSEIMFLTSFGMLMQLLPPFFAQVGKIIPEILQHLTLFLEKMFSAAVNDSDGNRNKGNNYYQNRGHQREQYSQTIPETPVKKKRGRPPKQDAFAGEEDFMAAVSQYIGE